MFHDFEIFVASASSEFTPSVALEKRWISAEWRPGLGTFIDDQFSPLQKTSGPHAEVGLPQPLCLG